MSELRFCSSSLGVVIFTTFLYLITLFIIIIGVQPSEVLNIRMQKWQNANINPEEICMCNIPHRRNLGKVCNQLAIAPISQPNVDAVIYPSVAMELKFTSAQEEYYTHSKDATEAVEKLCCSIDNFIDQVFHLSSEENSDDIVELSLSIIQELISSGMFKIATPFVVTLLHGTVTLSTLYRSRAYEYLVTALSSMEKRREILSFEKWFLNECCSYINTTQAELSYLPATMNNLINFLFVRKSKELLSKATDTICSETKPTYVLQPILSLHVSQIGLLPANSITRSVIYFINALLKVKSNTVVAIDYLMETVWLNPDLCEVAAKAVALLLPCNYFNLVNSTKGLTIPPKECDRELYKCEREIEDKVVSNQMTRYEAAMWYLDLIVNTKLIQTQYQRVLCLLKAAHYFVKEYSMKNAERLNSIDFALENAVTLLAYDASQLASSCLQPGSRIFTLATAYKLVCSVANIHCEDPTQHSCLRGRVACGLRIRLIYSSKFTYLLNQPMTGHDFWVAAASYMEKVSSLAQQAYVQQLLQIPDKLLPLRRALLFYQDLEMCYTESQLDSQHFSQKRVTAMSKLLSETKWTFDDVSKAMMTNLLQRDEEGFLKYQEELGENLAIAELKGVVFNYNEDSPSIQVVIKPAKDGNGLLSYRDIIEILQLNPEEISKIVFSLDPVSGTEKYHPFMKKRCYPTKLTDTEFMQTLFHADYVLKFLTTGMEVSAKPPFNLKPVQDSLIRDLPETLSFLHRPPYKQGSSHMKSHRYWIEVEEIFYDEDVTDTQAVYYIDEVKLQVKCRPMIVTLNGNIIDAKHSENGPHAKFSRELTDNYEEISKHFRIFARVKELSKLQFMVQKHHENLQLLKKENEKLFKAYCREVDHLHSLHPININRKSCEWVPATFNNLVYGGVHCSPKSSHFEYLQRSGAFSADSCSDALLSLEFSDAWKFMKCLKSFESARGIKIEIIHHHRVDSSTPAEDDFLCVTLGVHLTNTHEKSGLIHAVHHDEERSTQTAEDTQDISAGTTTHLSHTETYQDNDGKSDFVEMNNEKINEQERTKLHQLTDDNEDAIELSLPSERDTTAADKRITHESDCELKSDEVKGKDKLFKGHEMKSETEVAHKQACESFSETEVVGTISPSQSKFSPDIETNASTEKQNGQDDTSQDLLSQVEEFPHDIAVEDKKEPIDYNDKKAPLESLQEIGPTHEAEKYENVANHPHTLADKKDVSESASVTVQIHDQPNDYDKGIGQNKEKMEEKSVSRNAIPKTELSETINESDSELNVESESECESEAEYETESETNSESTENQSKYSADYSVEFDIETVMTHATQHQIMFLKRGVLKDTLSPIFCQSPLNQAIFGRTLNDPKFKEMLMTTTDFDETSFHPDMLACHQIKTAIVLRKIIEFHYKRGTENQLLSYM